MPVDASIPLSGNNAGLNWAGPMSLADLAAKTQQYKLTQQKIAGQNALAQIFSDPSNLDPTGNLTPQAQQKVMAVDPATGLKLREDAVEDQVRRAQAKHYETEAGVAKWNAISGLAGVGVDAYDEAKKQGASDKDATAAAQMARNEAAKGLGGVLGDDDIHRVMSSPFDPVGAKALARTNKEWAGQKDNAAKGERDEKRLDQGDARLAETTRHNTATEERLFSALANKADPTDAKWDVRADKDGTEYRYNPATAKATTLSGEPYTVKGAATKVGSTTGAAVSDDAADLIADQVLAGNRMAVTGSARNSASMTKINDAIAKKAKEQGLSGADISAKQAEFQGMVSGQRTLGTRGANMEVAANEVKYMAPLALSASEKVDRTKYPSLNAVLLAADKGTGGEDVVRFGLATNALIYSYAKFLNPTGIPTDADKARAADILSTAWAKGQYRTAVDQIQKEIATGKSAIGDTKREVSETIAGKKGEPVSAKPSGDTPKFEKGKVYRDKDGNRATWDGSKFVEAP